MDPSNSDAVAAFCAKDALSMKPNRNDAVSAVELDTAFIAQLLVPNNDPVMPAATSNDPVSDVLPETISPFLT
jgi:hypothetical protein